MKQVKVITAREAALLVKDNDVVASNGFVGSVQPEALTSALEARFLETGAPRDLTLIYAASQGNSDGRGGDHFAHEGMLKKAILGHWNAVTALQKLVNANKIQAYNLPQGTLAQYFRDVAAHRVGTITHVGLETFADPRVSGGRLNDVTTEDFVKVIQIDGKDQLFYPRMDINVALIRGTYADEWGNVVLTKEIAPLDATSIAQAAHNSGGTVIVQVEKIVKGGMLDPKLVKVPGIYVDYVVEAPETKFCEQTFDCEYNAALTGELTVPLHALAPVPLNAKKIIARRASLLLLDLSSEAIINLGIGIPEFIASVANEEGIGDSLTMTVEVGAVGGVPLGGVRFGASVNAEAILDQSSQFDFYDGGGLDLACLGLAECDGIGNINVSKFGPRIAGCGGFVNITQNTQNVVFCGTFTTGKLKEEIKDGKLTIIQEGSVRKFVPSVDHITFSGDYARKQGQHVYYITERAVFEMKEDGIHLTEIAPGIDLQKDVLDQMGFTPIMKDIKVMPEFIFKDELMGLKEMKANR